MTRRTRTAIAGSVLLAGVLLGTGCSPGPKNILAVERTESGEVNLLVANCPGYGAHDYSVLADYEDETLRSWSVHNESWMVSGSAHVGSVRVMAAAPEGWTTTDDNLPKLTRGVPYTASVRGAVGARVLSGRVEFTLADLEDLEKGQVLIAKDGDNEAADRADFLRVDPGQCKP